MKTRLKLFTFFGFLNNILKISWLNFRNYSNLKALTIFKRLRGFIRIVFYSPSYIRGELGVTIGRHYNNTLHLLSPLASYSQFPQVRKLTGDARRIRFRSDQKKKSLTARDMRRKKEHYCLCQNMIGNHRASDLAVKARGQSIDTGAWKRSAHTSQ